MIYVQCIIEYQLTSVSVHELFNYVCKTKFDKHIQKAFKMQWLLLQADKWIKYFEINVLYVACVRWKLSEENGMIFNVFVQ